MIKTFGNQELKLFFVTKGKAHVKCVPSELGRITYHKLLMIDQAKKSQDLRIIKGNHLEKLTSGKYTGYHSVRISRQYRLLFV